MDLASKLQVRPGAALQVIGVPDGVDLAGVAGGDGAAGVLAFVLDSADLPSADAAIDAALADRLAWIAYPKAGLLGTDLNRDRLIAAVTARGVRPVRAIALDSTWSALRFRPA